MKPKVLKKCQKLTLQQNDVLRFYRGNQYTQKKESKYLYLAMRSRGRLLVSYKLGVWTGPFEMSLAFSNIF